MANYEKMTLPEIEREIGIKPVNKMTVAFEKSQGMNTCSTWEEVSNLVKRLKNVNTYDRWVSILGYEKLESGQIRVYHHTHISGS